MKKTIEQELIESGFLVPDKKDQLIKELLEALENFVGPNSKSFGESAERARQVIKKAKGE